MKEIETQLNKTVEELKILYQMLNDKLEYMKSIDAYRPDVRRVDYQLAILKSVLENYFSTGGSGAEIGKGEYEIKVAIKIADSY